MISNYDAEKDFDGYEPKEYDKQINGYDLKCTCSACPEQYDVFDEHGARVGYLRLRHGVFRADYPYCGGETVYTSYPLGDGCFEADERDEELRRAVVLLRKKHEECTPA